MAAPPLIGKGECRSSLPIVHQIFEEEIQSANLLTLLSSQVIHPEEPTTIRESIWPRRSEEEV